MRRNHVFFPFHLHANLESDGSGYCRLVSPFICKTHAKESAMTRCTFHQCSPQFISLDLNSWTCPTPESAPKVQTQNPPSRSNSKTCYQTNESTHLCEIVRNKMAQINWTGCNCMQFTGWLPHVQVWNLIHSHIMNYIFGLVSTQKYGGQQYFPWLCPNLWLDSLLLCDCASLAQISYNSGWL